VQLALNRVNFLEESSSRPLHAVVDIASENVKTKRLLVIVGRSRRLATDSHQTELKEILTEKSNPIGFEVSKTLGEVATAFVASGVDANILVMQANWK